MNNIKNSIENNINQCKSSILMYETRKSLISQGEEHKNENYNVLEVHESDEIHNFNNYHFDSKNEFHRNNFNQNVDEKVKKNTKNRI